MRSLSNSYAPDKWTIRQVINHVNDGERVFLSRAFWFARGFKDALPGFDQDICVDAAGRERCFVDKFEGRIHKRPPVDIVVFRKSPGHRVDPDWYCQ